MTAKGGSYRRFLEVLAFFLVFAVFAFIAWGARQMVVPIDELTQTAITLDVINLPNYAMRTTLRMLIAVIFALLCALIYGTVAAKSRRLGPILISILDILQSVPVLGYIAFTVTAFVFLFPHSVLGIELAAIFAIFTAQAWNMAFSIYQSLRTIPSDLNEAAFIFKLSNWQKFWKVELPFAIPELLWNTTMSISASWFFIVASEAITVGEQKFMLPGIGAYIALAVQEKNLMAVGYAIVTMTAVIILYDQLLFRPLVAWSDKFRYELTSSVHRSSSSWVLRLCRKSKFIQMGIVKPLRWCALKVLNFSWLNVLFSIKTLENDAEKRKRFDVIWYLTLMVFGIIALNYVRTFVAHVGGGTVLQVFGLATITMLRVAVIIVLSALLWVPVGIYIGLNPRLTVMVQPWIQFLAAFPANLMFPLVAVVIARYSLNPDIWLTLLMMLGAQWYILFNVVAGASAIPSNLLEASRNFKVQGLLRWRKILLPAITPYFLTGAITAAGGAWNVSIVAEVVQWGNDKVTAIGLGSYITKMTVLGDFEHIALGIGVMSLLVVLTNRLLWRPLYNLTEGKLRLN